MHSQDIRVHCWVDSALFEVLYFQYNQSLLFTLEVLECILVLHIHINLIRIWILKVLAIIENAINNLPKIHWNSQSGKLYNDTILNVGCQWEKIQKFDFPHSAFIATVEGKTQRQSKIPLSLNSTWEPLSSETEELGIVCLDIAHVFSDTSCGCCMLGKSC